MKQRSRSKGSAASEVLKRDHRQVDDLFQRFEACEEGSPESLELLKQITFALSVHARIEEEIYYPAARMALGDEAKDLLDEAAVEHASLKKLLVELSTMVESDYFFRAKVKVLGEYVKHHVREEEEELMPMIDGTDLDFEEIGQALMQRREALMGALSQGMEEMQDEDRGEDEDALQGARS